MGETVLVHKTQSTSVVSHSSDQISEISATLGFLTIIQHQSVEQILLPHVVQREIVLSGSID